MSENNNSRGGCNGRQGPGSFPLLMTVEGEKSAAVDADWGTADLTKAASWEKYGRIYARAVTNGGKEFYQQVQQFAETTHVWKTKSTETSRGISPLMRLVWSNRVFQVVSVIDVDEARDTVLISTKETVPTRDGV